MNSQKLITKKTMKKKKVQYYYAMQFDFQSERESAFYFAYSLPITLTEITESIIEKEHTLQEEALKD
jgi:hypothetical protein